MHEFTQIEEEIGNCIGCNEPLRAGQVVTAWDDEVGHYNCRDPYSLKRQPDLDQDPDTPPPAVLLGNPATYVPLARLTHSPASDLCDDCPPVGYVTDKTRCLPCPRRSPASDVGDSEPDPDCEYCFGTGSVETGGDEAHTAFSVACICTATAEQLAALTPTTLASADDGLCTRTLEEAAKCWIVWAMKPGDLQLVAICSKRSIASNYQREAKMLFPDHRLTMEDAPIDHLFGAADLRSVAFRASIANLKPKPEGEG